MWRTRRAGGPDWDEPPAYGAPDARGRRAAATREVLQQALLFPAVRAVAHPRVSGADDLLHAPQPAILAANHASDLDTPLILGALPRAWRSRTLVAAAADRFYASRRAALATTLFIGTFPFDRAGDGRGLAQAAALLEDGSNVLLYPQATRSQGRLGGFRTGVAHLALGAGVPVVPVHVGGTALLMPKGRGLIQRGHTTVRFGRPLHPRASEEPGVFAERLAGAVAALGS